MRLDYHQKKLKGELCTIEDRLQFVRERMFCDVIERWGIADK